MMAKPMTDEDDLRLLLEQLKAEREERNELARQIKAEEEKREKK